MASRRHVRCQRSGTVRVCHQTWVSPEVDDFSDTSSVSSTDATKSHSEPATDDEDEPLESVEFGEASPQLEPPTEADMEEMEIIASSTTTDEILTKMLGRHDVGERRSAIIATMQTVRASVQQQFNVAINTVIQGYVQNFFEPAVQNLKGNFGESSKIIDKDILEKISCDLLDNSKLQYNAVSVRPRTPLPLPILTDPEALPLYESTDSEEFSEMPLWLSAESPTLGGVVGLGRVNVVTPVELTQRLTELQNGDVPVTESPRASEHDNISDSKVLTEELTYMEDSKSSGLALDSSGWLGIGRLVKRWPLKRAYCFSGGDDGGEGEGEEAESYAPEVPKKFRSKYSHLSNNLLRSLMTLLYKHKMFWNASVITTTTKFLTDIQANMVFGYSVDGKKHFPTYHPDVVRYMPDLEDRDWLLQQKLIEQPHARVLLLVYDEVGYIRATDCRYRLKPSIDLSAIRTFTLPEFIIEKMKKFFSQLNLASRGVITFQKPVGRELNSALRRCLPLVPAHYSAFANWAIAAAATERNRSPSKELLSIFRASFEAVAAMVKRRRRLELLAERRGLEESATRYDLGEPQNAEATQIEDDDMEGGALDETQSDQEVQLDIAATPIRNLIDLELFSAGKPLPLPTVEILSKIPATVTVTPRNSNPAIQLKTASAEATTSEWTIIRKVSQQKCHADDFMPDVSDKMYRQNRLFRPLCNSGMRMANDDAVEFTLSPEFVILRRCSTGGYSLPITADAE